MREDDLTLGIDPAAGHPERRLAWSYAHASDRPALIALFALDATLARLVRGTRDSMVAGMRLEWWHQALGALDAAPPPPQPVLRALAEAVLPRGVSGAGLTTIVEGWEALLDGEDAAARHARDRGAALFAAAGRVLDAAGDPIEKAGEGWALADLALHSLDPALAASARAMAEPLLRDATSARWSREGRALGAMAHGARMDLAGSTPGSPRRVARLLRHRLTGG